MIDKKPTLKEQTHDFDNESGPYLLKFDPDQKDWSPGVVGRLNDGKWVYFISPTKASPYCQVTKGQWLVGVYNDYTWNCFSLSEFEKIYGETK